MTNTVSKGRFVGRVLATALLLIALLGAVACGRSEKESQDPNEDASKTRAIPDPMTLE